MKFYALSQKNPPGCPSFELSAELYDNYAKNSSQSGFGHFPWYARKRGDESPVFTDTMTLVTHKSSHSHDIIRISPHIYIASKKFFTACKELGAKLVDSRKITIASRNGASLGKDEYYTMIFTETSLSSALSEDSQLIYNKYGKVCRVKKIKIKNSFHDHIFRLENMEGTSNALICSETFRTAVHDDLKQIEFIDVDHAEWPRIKPA